MRLYSFSFFNCIKVSYNNASSAQDIKLLHIHQNTAHILKIKNTFQNHKVGSDKACKYF